MLRFIAIFIVFLQISVFADDSLPFKEYKTKLINITENMGKIPDSDLIVVGSSGIVMHSFDNEKSTIIARAVVTKKDGEFATVKFEVFDMLEQAAFPLPGIVPQKDDEITLNYLYNRALIVAPNEPIFKEITNHFSGIQWIHPDIMAAYLSTDYKPNPSKYNFDTMCRQNSAGVIFFALNRKGYFADCQSLSILKTYNSGTVTKYQLPFYNRIGGVDTVFWKWSGSQIEDYDDFYSKLLGV